MRDSAVRHLAASRLGRIIAAAEFRSTVSLWDLETQTKQSEFETILDFGGTRLAVDEEGQRCIVGAYHVDGIACYNGLTGEIIWQRKDLKKVQELAILPSQNEVACGFDNGPLQILSMRSGKTLQKIRGCRKLYLSPYEPVQFADKTKPRLETLDGSPIFQIDRESFAIIAFAFGNAGLAISEAGGPVRCFSITSGELLWRYTPPQGSHIVNLGYDNTRHRFLGVEWPFEKGGPNTLLVFSSDGTVEARFALGSSIVLKFCRSGTRLVSSSGWLINTATGKLEGNLQFPTKDYPDEEA